MLLYLCIQAKCGEYQNIVNTPILKSLLEADIVLLLRYALDEKSDLVIAAAVSASHSLLTFSQSDMVRKQMFVKSFFLYYNKKALLVKLISCIHIFINTYFSL